MWKSLRLLCGFLFAAFLANYIFSHGVKKVQDQIDHQVDSHYEERYSPKTSPEPEAPEQIITPETEAPEQIITPETEAPEQMTVPDDTQISDESLPDNEIQDSPPEQIETHSYRERKVYHANA